MRIARVIDDGNKERWASQDAAGKLTALEGDPWAGFKQTSREVKPWRWLPPVEPRAILCIGRNYRKHAEESHADIPTCPVLFMKNPAAATGHNDQIRIPAVCGNEVDYEAEISFLSEDTTLLPGTVILTGTPEGVGWARTPKLLLHPGDEFSVEIEKVGRLTNRVSAAAGSD